MTAPTHSPRGSTSSSLQRRLGALRHIVLDLDGTLYLDDHLFTWTKPFLEALRRMGVGYTFLTNNSSRSTGQYVRKLHRLGVVAQPEEIYLSTHNAIDYLQRRHPSAKSVFALGPDGLREEFTNAGFDVAPFDTTTAPQVVVVGFDTDLTYKRLCQTAYWIQQGIPFIATHPDRVCPTQQATVLVDCGSILQCLITATGREPEAVLGKPNPQMLYSIRDRHRLEDHQVGMVGDRLYTDIAMARAANMMAILTLSGESTEKEALESTAKPDLIIQHVGELTDHLFQARECKS